MLSEEKLINLIKKTKEENKTELFFMIKELYKIPPELGILTNLSRLLLRSNQIISKGIPQEIGNLIKLQELDLSFNRLSYIPKEIFKLRNLSSLSLGNNSIEKASKGIGELHKLQKLELGSNRITSLPEEIGQLRNLSLLKIGGNQLTCLPKGIGNMAMLRELYLAENRITKLPEEIGNLKNLEKISAFKNKINFLPREIGCLSKLSELSIGENNILSLPTEIGNLQQLVELHLYSNFIEFFPFQIGNLRKLRRLNAWGNKIQFLPKEIGNLVSLKEMYLNKNKITSIPPEIGNLNNLRELYLPENELTSIPPEIGNLKSLQTLSFTDNKLTSVPLEIGKLSNLQGLYLVNNNLTYLPLEIKNLQNLSVLSLHQNSLQTLPKFLTSLKNLRELNIDFCLLREFLEDYLDAMPQLEKVGIYKGDIRFDISENLKEDKESIIAMFDSIKDFMFVKSQRNKDDKNVYTVQRQDKIFTIEIFHRNSKNEKLCDTYTQIRHPSVVQCFTQCKLNNSLYVVFEPQKMSLQEVVDKSSFSKKMALRIIKNLASVSEYLYTKYNILHSLNLKEIFICSKRIKLKLLNKTSQTQLVDMLYYVPNHLEKDNPDQYKNNIYLLGVFLYYFLCGSKPYSEHNIIEILDKIENSTIQPRPIPGISKQTQYVLNRAMANNPTDRFHSFVEMKKAIKLALDKEFSNKPV
ncbi:leucine-rich repeat-containing protein kinase family protein [Candidatus Uabimicrobium sp. HlEnr_7]|uniref:leucine-rich repeat-containing protein kinase family protein n=1 Tax=Candidatus Uabimicrobium helgolandensis TaxID=3095367 RepID=UPI003558B9D2